MYTFWAYTDLKMIPEAAQKSNSATTTTPANNKPADQKKVDQKKTAVKTGDTTNVLPWLLVLIASIGSTGGCIIYKKRR